MVRWFECALVCGLLLLQACAQPQSLQLGSGGQNLPRQQTKPYVILISLDGFRWDYQDLANTPALDRIASSGIKADALIPVFPTLTFPNHYSIATGLYPINHGLRGNTFASPDREHWYSLRDRSAVQNGSWYRGDPIWVTAERNGMVAAAYFFVGTEAPIGGIRPTHWNTFDASIPDPQRVAQVLRWLALPKESRPHLITLYFEAVDSVSHAYGPASPPSLKAVEHVDGQLQRLLEGIDAMAIRDEVYFVVVSDHGQATYKPEEPYFIDDHVDLSGIEVVDHGSAAFLYLKDAADTPAEIRDRINDSWSHGRAWLPGEAPQEWHLQADAGFADVIVQAEAGHAVVSERKSFRGLSRGDHGWAPDVAEMRGIFLASGPDLPKGKRIPPIHVVDVYPLLMSVLDLPYGGEIDGNPDALLKLLR